MTRTTGIASAATAQTFECEWTGRVAKDAAITAEFFQNSGGNLDLVGVRYHT